MDAAAVWDAGGPVDAPPLRGDTSAEVCVIGLGGAGLAAVRRLGDRGVDVVGVDAGAIGGGASGRNGGFLLGGGARFHHRMAAQVGHARAAALHRATLRELDRLASDVPHLVRRVGSLRIAADGRELEDVGAHRDALAAGGIAVADYEGPEGRGLLLPDDAAFDPAAACRTEAAALVADGAALHERTAATRLVPGAVVTAAGTIACEAVVVAVDGGLERIVPELAGRVRTARGQVLATAPVDEPLFPRPVYRRWGLDYLQQLPDGRVVLGGGRDRGGAAEWTTEAVPTAAVQAHLEGLLRDGLGVRAPVTHRWAGTMGFTDDGLPVVEEVREGVVASATRERVVASATRERVVACGGYGGTGNLVGRLAGRAAADLVVDGRSDLADLLAARP